MQKKDAGKKTTTKKVGIQMSFTFITEGVQGVDHELKDAVPHQGVVQRGTAAFPLQPGFGLRTKANNPSCQ